jgi:hypothetical protein
MEEMVDAPGLAPVTKFRWAANILMMAATGAALVAAMIAPNLPRAVVTFGTEDITSRAKALAVEALGHTLGDTEVHIVPDGTTAVWVPSLKATVGIRPEFWSVKDAGWMTLGLLVGAIAAGRIWRAGWIRQSLMVVSAIVLPLVVLAALDVLCLAVLVQNPATGWETAGYGNFVLIPQARRFAVMAVVIGLWASMKLLIVDDDEEARRPARRGWRESIAAAPAAAWAAVAATIIYAIMTPFVCLGMIRLHETLSVASLGAGRAVLAGAASVLALLFLIGKRRAGRWAWLPLALMVLLGGDDPGGVVLAVVVIAVLAPWPAAASPQSAILDPQSSMR